jgi:hypothetical protein
MQFRRQMACRKNSGRRLINSRRSATYWRQQSTISKEKKKSYFGRWKINRTCYRRLQGQVKNVEWYIQQNDHSRKGLVQCSIQQNIERKRLLGCFTPSEKWRSKNGGSNRATKDGRLWLGENEDFGHDTASWQRAVSRYADAMTTDIVVEDAIFYDLRISGLKWQGNRWTYRGCGSI